MNRINTNIAAFMAHRSLNMHNERMYASLRNLSTGLRVESAKDDPAGLVASNQMRSEIVGINAAMNSISRGEQIISTAEGAIAEINELLLEMQGMITESANQGGLGDQERTATQQDIDMILESIDRIATGTEFGGTKLLNGGLDYETRGSELNRFDWVHVNSARLGTTGAPLDVHTDILVEAEQAEAAITLDGAGVFSTSMGLTVSFEITGPEGVQQFTFADGTNKLDMEAAISTFADELGIEVDLSSNDELIIRSRDYGSDQMVNVRVTEANGQDANGSGFVKAFNGTQWTVEADNEHTDNGVDAQVLINGQMASVQGLVARVVANGFDLEVRIAEEFNTTSGFNFQIVSGGAFFDVAAGVSRSDLATLGIRSMSTGSIGGIDGVLDEIRSGGSAAIADGDLLKAERIVDAALEEVASIQGRLGSFMRFTLESSRNTLGETLEQVTAAESSIRDADLAWETAALARHQILSQSAMQALSLANSQPMQILSLLGSA
ncbi:MAG: flagellin [Phycisphaerales bacterium]|nr:flagellin [Phycisphaerales bacterium]